MIHSIIEAISISLNEEFGDRYETHMEVMKQDLKEPCFFIFCVNPTMKIFFGKRYFRTHPFCIQYFPETDEKQRECADVAERMYSCLEYITILGDDKPMMGTRMKYEVIDGVLNFFVNYDCFVRKSEKQTPMESLQASTSVKEGG